MSQPRSDTPTADAPIADLSYRRYEGTLRPGLAWLTVAKATLGLSMQRKTLVWILIAIATLPFLGSGLTIFMNYLSPQSGLGEVEPAKRVATALFGAMQHQTFWIFILALATGAGCIAADNKANALLVYLSKPMTRADYVFGKWLGVFFLPYVVTAAPPLGVWVFALLLDNKAVIQHELMLPLTILLACTVPAAVHASFLVGISAWSKTGFNAGAIYASIYVISGTLGFIKAVEQYSIPSLIKGVAQNIYNVKWAPGFGKPLPPPDFAAVGGITLALIALGLFLAWRRVRAVEVVSG